MRADDIFTVFIIGAGTVGQQIGLPCAMHGHEIEYYDILQEISDKALNRVAKFGSRHAPIVRLTES